MRLLCILFFFIPFQLQAEEDTEPSQVIVISLPSLSQLSPASTVITAQDLKEKGATNLAEVLRNQGSIQLRDSFGDGTTTEISMRGFGGNAASNTLVILDGQPLNGIDIAPPDLTTLPVEDIEKIEIIPGSASVLYGDQAVGGVIQITTRFPHKRTLQLKTATGSFEQKLYNASFANLHDNGISYRLSAQQQKSDNFRDRNNLELSHFLGRINYQKEATTLFAEYGFFGKDLQLPGALTAAQLAQDRRLARNQTDFLDSETERARIGFKQLFSPYALFETELAAKASDTEGVMNSSALSQKRVLYTFHPRFTLLLPNQYQDHNLTTGLDLDQNEYKITSPFGKTDAEQQMASVYVELQYFWSDKFSTIVGTRYSKFKTDLLDSTAFPKGKDIKDDGLGTSVGFYYEAFAPLTVFIRAEKNFRFPKVDEQTFASNQILESQQGISYETGLDWKNKNYQSKFMLYRLDLDNEIEFDPSIAPSGANANLSPTRRYGALWDNGLQLATQWTLHAEYAFTYARFTSGTFKDNRLPLVADHTLRFSLNFHVNDHFTAFLESQTTGNRYANGDYQNDLSKASGFTIFNSNLIYQWKDLSLGLRINNLTNKKYNEVTIKNFDNTLGFFPSPERNIMLTLSFTK